MNDLFVCNGDGSSSVNNCLPKGDPVEFKMARIFAYLTNTLD